MLDLGTTCAPVRRFNSLGVTICSGWRCGAVGGMPSPTPRSRPSRQTVGRLATVPGLAQLQGWALGTGRVHAGPIETPMPGALPFVSREPGASLSWGWRDHPPGLAGSQGQQTAHLKGSFRVQTARPTTASGPASSTLASRPPGPECPAPPAVSIPGPLRSMLFSMTAGSRPAGLAKSHISYQISLFENSPQTAAWQQAPGVGTLVPRGFLWTRVCFLSSSLRHPPSGTSHPVQTTRFGRCWL